MRLKLDIENFADRSAAAVNQGIPRESEVRSQDGRWYLLRSARIELRRSHRRGDVVLVDIDALAQTQESLRNRVAELAIADRHKNEFLAILAHELRNPLAPLRNAVQILKLSPADVEVSAKARELIERQVNTCRAWWVICSMPRVRSTGRSSCSANAGFMGDRRACGRHDASAVRRAKADSAR